MLRRSSQEFTLIAAILFGQGAVVFAQETGEKERVAWPRRAKIAWSEVASAQETETKERMKNALLDDNVAEVKALLEAGFDPNTEFENRATALFLTSNLEIIDLLLAHGARIDIHKNSGQTPLEEAAQMVSLHEKEPEENWSEEDRDDWKKRREDSRKLVACFREAGAEYTTATAIYLNDVDFIRSRLADDASWVNRRSGYYYSPLAQAASTGRVEICKLLLEHKADPNCFERGLGIPIICNAVHNAEIVKLLIDRGANLKRRISYHGGRSGVWIIGDEATALHYAAGAGNLETVKLLIEAGLDPSAADVEGQTPLHIAIRHERWWNDSKEVNKRYLEIIEYLLENDASLEFTDREGRTPLELAKETKSPREIRRLLQKKREETIEAYNRATFDRDEAAEK